ncbi:hypothetical protein SAMN03159423_2468 [Bradyrhizobium sp. NFR13]|nr:hypothetical protein SAMN03159423_2468 [Bradyrhizobium sp. NFR13]
MLSSRLPVRAFKSRIRRSSRIPINPSYSMTADLRALILRVVSHQPSVVGNARIMLVHATQTTRPSSGWETVF